MAFVSGAAEFAFLFSHLLCAWWKWRSHSGAWFFHLRNRGSNANLRGSYLRVNDIALNRFSRLTEDALYPVKQFRNLLDIIFCTAQHLNCPCLHFMKTFPCLPFPRMDPHYPCPLVPRGQHGYLQRENGGSYFGNGTKAAPGLLAQCPGS